MVQGNGREHAVFESDSGVRDALARLAEAGVPAGDIEVRSSVPLPPDVRPSGQDVRTRVPIMAVLGGLLGGTAAFLLTSLTALDYPLPTGGMPIVALPPSGIITFEGVAIGAILCTVATVFYECRLVRRGLPPGPLDAHLAAGDIVVSVAAADGVPSDWAGGAVLRERDGRTG